MAAVLCSAQENRIPFADPYILEADGIYYMYGTSYDDGIGVVMSTDLKNWTVPGGTERHVALSCAGPKACTGWDIMPCSRIIMAGTESRSILIFPIRKSTRG